MVGKQTLTEITTKTEPQKAVNTVQPDYVDLTIIPRAPGEDFDTYRGYWNDCGIQVRGPVSYNTQKYPTLVNGVPVTSMSITTYDGNSVVNYSNTGPDGSVFAVTQIYMGNISFSAFHTDITNYLQASDVYQASGNAGSNGPPLISTFVTGSYSTAGTSKTYVGKLIRVTTGSHLAVAKFDYILPPAAATPIPNLAGAVIQDGVDSHKSYLLRGTNGNITTSYIATDNVANANNRAIATGSYTSSGVVFHYWGTVITPDGRSIPFNVTAQLD